jgi:DNA-binding SARP family transcriptional activator
MAVESVKARGFGIDAARFVPPALDHAVERGSLIAAIDSLPAPARWLCAPSGAGKSTLVADVARHHAGNVIWYRLDERDDDPAFFFGEWLRHVRLRLSIDELPHFSDSDRGQEVAFARRLLAALMPSLAAPLLLVFDDIHKLACARTSAVLAALASAAGAQLRLIFAGQQPPPVEFYGAIAERRLALCGDVDLRFTPADCLALARRLRLHAPSGDELHALTGGHAAALVLACELMRGTGGQSKRDPEAAERVHLYLLGQLLAVLPESQRELLLRCCWLPSLDAALVAQVVGRPDVDADLEALADRGLLIRHRVGERTTYVAHALVAQGGQTLARQTEHRSWAERCATALHVQSREAEAFDLWIALGRMDEALESFGRLAERYARERRSDLLQAGLRKLPAAEVQGSPALCFWIGHAMLGVDEPQARHWFGLAHDAAPEGSPTRALAAACVLISYLQYARNLNALMPWVKRFDSARTTVDATNEPYGHLVPLAMLCARYFGVPGSIAGDVAEQALEALLPHLAEPAHWPSPHLQLCAATVMVDYTRAMHGIERGRHVALLTARLGDDPAASPLLRGRWWVERAWLYANEPEGEQFGNCLAKIDRLADAAELPALRFQSLRLRCAAAMRGGREHEAATLLPEMERVVEHLDDEDIGEFGRLSAGVLMMTGRPKEALVRAEAALRVAERRPDRAPGENRLYEIEYAQALAANARFDEAVSRLRQSAAADTEEVGRSRLALAEAYVWLASGGADLSALRRCLELAAAATFFPLLVRAPGDLARACDTALVHDIEAQFVYDLIARRRLKPPPGASERWPWRIRVYALGTFRLEVGGSPYRPPHKSQDKVLDLLKLIVAAQVLRHGPAERSWLCEHLWPDAEPAKARKSLEMTVTRLRRLFDCDAAVVVSEGRVRLDAELVWTDVGRFLQGASRVSDVRDARVGQRGVGPHELRRELDGLLGVYAGAFLTGDDEDAWVVGTRTQLSRVLRTVLGDCERLLDEADEAQVTGLLERALLVEPTSEEITRMLMRRYLRRAEHGQAMRVYRRCSEVMNAMLGVGPSVQTEALRQEVYRAAEGDVAARGGMYRV